jgi:hypothetical protein
MAEGNSDLTVWPRKSGCQISRDQPVPVGAGGEWSDHRKGYFEVVAEGLRHGGMNDVEGNNSQSEFAG